MKLIEPEQVFFWLGSESERAADYFNITVLEAGEVLPACPIVELDQEYE